MWLQRHLNDVYVTMAAKNGYRSRASFKLLEIEEKFQILKGAENILDIGAAPGGWLQVVKEKASNAVNLVGVDLQKIQPMEGVTLIQGDFLELMQDEQFVKLCPMKLDLILSDVAFNSCGDNAIDHVRIVQFVFSALEFAISTLNPGRHFIAKLLKGGEDKDVLLLAKKHFKCARFFKPKASYKDSSELYLIALGFCGQHSS